MPDVKGKRYVRMYCSSAQSHKDIVNTSDVTVSAYAWKMLSTCPRSRAWPTLNAPITGNRRKFISVIVKEGGRGRERWTPPQSRRAEALGRNALRGETHTYAQHVHNKTSANVSALTWWMTITVCYFNTRGMTTYKLIQSQSNELHLNIQQIRWHQTWFWAFHIQPRRPERLT